jgi:hypothetical protein
MNDSAYLPNRDSLSEAKGLYFLNRRFFAPLKMTLHKVSEEYELSTD